LASLALRFLGSSACDRWRGKDFVNKGATGDSGSLLLASKLGLEAVVRELLEKGARLESQSQDDLKTPLILAAEHGYEAVVRVLLGRGANLKKRYPKNILATVSRSAQHTRSFFGN
jgi:ankyrin repeat protein